MFRDRAQKLFGARMDTDRLRVSIGQAGLAAVRASQPHFRDLWDAELTVFSQWGEDGILSFLCDSLNIIRPRVVEFGAGDFTECNSRFLAEARGASVLAVDARRELEGAIANLEVRWRATVVPRVTWITPESAPLLADEARRLFGGLDIVSLDLDGNDYWVAKALDFRGVSIVVVEYNALLGHTRRVSVPRDDNFIRESKHWSWLYYGASLRAYIDLLAERGLDFVGTNRACNNAFFVRDPPEVLRRIANRCDLSAYTDVRFREGRRRDGTLALDDPRTLLSVDSHLPLVDLQTGESCPISEVL